MMASIENHSSHSVTLRRITPIWSEGQGTVAEVYRVTLGPRATDGPIPYLGVFLIYPPVAKIRGRCVVQPVDEVTGYRLHPGEKVAILLWIRGLAAGRFHITGERVIYEAGGTLQEQLVPFEIEGPIRRRTKPPVLKQFDAHQAACIEEANIVLAD